MRDDGVGGVRDDGVGSVRDDGVGSVRDDNAGGAGQRKGWNGMLRYFALQIQARHCIDRCAAQV